MAIRNKTFMLSAVIMILSVCSIISYGLVMGLEFTGGTQMEVSFDKAIDLNTVRGHLAESTQNINIQSIGGSKDLLIRIEEHLSS